MGSSQPAFPLEIAQDDTFPALLSPCRTLCSSTRKTKADQGSRWLRQRVRGFKAGLQPSEGRGEIVEDSRGRRRQDLLCPVLQLSDLKQSQRCHPDLQGGDDCFFQCDDQGREQCGGQRGGSGGLYAFHPEESKG